MADIITRCPYLCGPDILYHQDCTTKQVALDYSGVADGCIKAGTPINAAGAPANDGTAVGILKNDSYKGFHAFGKIIIGGYVRADIAQENSGVELSSSARAAMSNVAFVGADGVVAPSGGATSWNDLKDRPFYDKSLVSVSSPGETGVFWYKVSDSVPAGDHSEGATCCSLIDGVKSNGQISLSTDDYYCPDPPSVFVALKDNAVLEGITFPERGTYFLGGTKYEGGFYAYVTGFALGRDADPEITWDGSTGEIKTLDEKFLPPVSGLIVKSSTAESTKKFRITVDDSGTISATEV